MDERVWRQCEATVGREAFKCVCGAVAGAVTRGRAIHLQLSGRRTVESLVVAIGDIKG